MTGFELERHLFHWPAVLMNAPSGWAKNFAVSIARQSRRSHWKPSQKQAAIMRKMVQELFVESCATSELEVIEED